MALRPPSKVQGYAAFGCPKRSCKNSALNPDMEAGLKNPEHLDHHLLHAHSDEFTPRQAFEFVSDPVKLATCSLGRGDPEVPVTTVGLALIRGGIKAHSGFTQVTEETFEAILFCQVSRFCPT